MEDNKNKKIIIMVVGILVLLVALATATYAWFSAKSNAEERNITTAKEELIVTPTKDPIHVENIKPVKVISNALKAFGGCIPEDNDNLVVEGYGGTRTKTCSISATTNNKRLKDVVSIPISVTSNSTIDINYNLYISLENLKLNDNLEGGTSEDIKWILYKLSSKDGTSNVIVESDYSGSDHGDFYDPSFKQLMVSNIAIKSNQTQYYMLFVYIEESESDQNKLQGIEFDVKIEGNTETQNIAGKKLKDVILSNNVVKERDPNFKLTKYGSIGSNNYYQSSDDGLFKLKGKDVYYFRGTLKNTSSNFIYFGRFKNRDNLYNIDDEYNESPILWKILKINTDGSITLLFYPEVSINNSTITTNILNYEGSEIEQVLNTWYENTFTDKEKEMIMETTYCNDRSEIYEGVNKRLNKEIPEPTLDCNNEDKVTANIALPTADELIYTGSLVNNDINSYINGTYGTSYMASFTSAYLTMSPSSSNSVFYGESQKIKDLKETNIYNNYIHPVITLKPNVKISKFLNWNNDIIVQAGFGTYEAPYLVGYDE